MLDSRESVQFTDENLGVLIPPYVILAELGEGTYGKVFKCRNITTDEIVAIKKTQVPEGEEQNGIPSTTLREMSVLKRLDGHPNVVQLIDVILTKNLDYYLVFEFVHQDLKRYLHEKSTLKHKEVQIIMFQILQAVYHCHRHNMFHRDLKPANILISETGHVKIADFGLAKLHGHPIYRAHSREVQTLWYRSPEIMLGSKGYSGQIDIFSVGCIFGELLTGRVMFPGTCEVDTLFRIFEYMGTPEEADVTHRPTRSVTDRPLNLPTAPQWSGLSLLPEYGTFKFPRFKGTKMPEMLYGPEATDLLHRMLELDPKRRINALDAVRHPYFDSLAPEERLKFN